MSECIVIPPLHTLQGLINKVLHIFNQNDKSRWFSRFPFGKENACVRPVFECLLNMLKSATPNKIGDDKWEDLDTDIRNLPQSWRAAGLPAINKLHLIEAHLSQFIKMYGSWGLYGEQGIEALHRTCNNKSARCFGVNKTKKLEVFMKEPLMSYFGTKFEQGSGAYNMDDEDGAGMRDENNNDTDDVFIDVVN